MTFKSLARDKISIVGEEPMGDEHRAMIEEPQN